MEHRTRLSASQRRAQLVEVAGRLFAERGYHTLSMEQLADAALAPRNVAELLHVRPRTPLLLFERTYFASSGEPVEYAISYQVTRRYPYRVVLARADRRS